MAAALAAGVVGIGAGPAAAHRSGSLWDVYSHSLRGAKYIDGVPPTGCLVEIGFPRFGGGLGGYARFVAICPPDTPAGVSVGQVPEAPLTRYDTPLHWDTSLGIRVR